jgi:tetratricopeptide (TPR) repeat protein
VGPLLFFHHMTLNRPLITKLLVPVAAFAATLAVIVLLNRATAPSSDSASPADGVPAVPGASTDRQIAALEQSLAGNPAAAELYAALGNAFLQKARETGDPGFYGRAESAFEQGLRRDPHDAGTLTGLSALALARHDFKGGLRYGLRAHAEAPEVVRPYGVIVDAQIELGRYDDAARTLQEMVDLKPNLASYSRVSYFRELHGDLRGAIEAMRLAASAGGDAPENLAYVQTLLGNLEFERGRLGASAAAHRLALSRYPAYAPAEAGLARVEAARGRLGGAIRRYRAVVARLPLPEYVIALGEAELAAGRVAAARRDLALVSVEQRLQQQNEVNVDTELAVFEANHGDADRAVGLARQAWSNAPSVRSADALGWALTRAGRPAEGLAWARRALKLGSADPAFLYHAGIAARAAGRDDLARRWLARSVSLNPRWSPLYAPQAERALRGLR